MLANKYYKEPENNDAKEKYLGKLLNTIGEITGVNAFDMFDRYSKGGKRVVANMSGATGGAPQDPNNAPQPYKAQGVVRKAGNKRKRF